MTDEEMSEWNWFSSVPFKLLGSLGRWVQFLLMDGRYRLEATNK